jgi:hypothetical protein
MVETFPGGVDFVFRNRVTGEITWYTPKGMTAEDILQIPRARRYWAIKEDVEAFMERMAAANETYGGYDVANECEAQQNGESVFCTHVCF